MMPLKKTIIFILLGAVSAAFDGQTRSDAPPTIEQALQALGITISVPYLLKALTDPRHQVRGLAAAELASIKDQAAIPNIEAAMEREQNTGEKINMASSLLQLGSPKGTETLGRMCRDANLADYQRQLAALRSDDNGKNICLPVLEQFLRDTDDSGLKTSMILAIGKIKQIPPDEMKKINADLISNLSDPDSSVRLYTAKCIESLNDTEVKKSLEKAALREQDNAVRNAMAETLKQLR